MDRIRVEERRSVRPCRARRGLTPWVIAAASAAALTLAPATSVAATPPGAAAWGYNASGQLGNGSTTLSHVPVAVSGLSGVKAVAGGAEHSLALLENGTVMAWGNNREGQLGNGSSASSHLPVLVSGLTGVVAIAAGKEHSLALLENGTVMDWGGNAEGQLGTGKTTRSTVPVAVKGLTGVRAVSAGAEFNLALLSNGTVMAWGANGEGQLGDGKFAKGTVPVSVKGLTGVSAISAGEEHSLALLSNGTLMSWGSNASRQLGVPAEVKEKEEIVEETEIEHSDVPVAVQQLSGVTAIAAGGQHNIALLGDGTVAAWGSNHTDQLGNGTTGGASNLPSPVSGLSGVSSIAAGGRHSLALLSGGAVVGWGYNADGQLGNGANVNSPVPVAVASLSGALGIAAGGLHSLSFGVPGPSVSSVSPSSGPAPGGTSVTISGANLAEASAVDFGASEAGSFVVNSSSSITAVAPAGSGTVDVTVTTPVGTSAVSAADRFGYLPAPAITKVKLNKGPAEGGTSLTITGSNLTGATSVDFGASPAASFTVSSATSITAVSPAATTGVVDITVSTPSGTSAISTHDRFTYGAPTITGLSPNAGPVAGGTSVTITGSGFAIGTSATAFLFGKAPASSVSCSSTSTCLLLTPAAKAGTVDVKATVAKKNSVKSPPADQFTYQ
jgi:alpha-tubulin suppressor-like RCC1 family protein